MLQLLHFNVQVNSSPEEDSRPALQSMVSRIMQNGQCAQMMLQLLNLPTLFVLETLDITSTSPSHLAVTGSLSRSGMRSCLRLILRREYFLCPCQTRA